MSNQYESGSNCSQINSNNNSHDYPVIASPRVLKDRQLYSTRRGLSPLHKGMTLASSPLPKKKANLKSLDKLSKDSPLLTPRARKQLLHSTNIFPTKEILCSSMSSSSLSDTQNSSTSPEQHEQLMISPPTLERRSVSLDIEADGSSGTKPVYTPRAPKSINTAGGSPLPQGYASSPRAKRHIKNHRNGLRQECLTTSSRTSVARSDSDSSSSVDSTTSTISDSNNNNQEESLQTTPMSFRSATPPLILSLQKPPELRRTSSGRSLKQLRVVTAATPSSSKQSPNDLLSPEQESPEKSSPTFQFSLWKTASKRRMPADAIIIQPRTDLPKATLHQSKMSPTNSLASRKKSFVKDQDEFSALFQWKRGDLLGEGTFGKVFMALKSATGELFAVKQIDVMPKKRNTEKLQEEIAVMKDLDHKHIVRYVGTETSGESLYIFMEYVPGGSIASMLKTFGTFSEDLIARYTRQILLGVEYLHSKGIVHRDIKGANVLVNEQGVAKLADFGCSKQLNVVKTSSLEESLRSIRGSVPWMAPEVIKQTGHDMKADIWSVGATVIEMASAKHPWPAFTNNLSVMYSIATTTTSPPIPEELSPVAKSFLERCFAIDPTERASATELLNHPFLAI